MTSSNRGDPRPASGAGKVPPAADRKRDHASRISFWLRLGRIEIDYDQAFARNAPAIEIVLEVVNSSDRPGMSVMAMIGVRSDVWRDAAAADGAESDERVAEWTAPAIAPGSQMNARKS